MATTKPLPRNPNLTDLLDRLDAMGNLIDIREVLDTQNEMIADACWVQCNNKFSHKTTVRTGLPSVAWRMLNYGVQPSKSTVASVFDTCGMLEAFAVVDKKLVEMNGKKESWRASEEHPFIEAMSNEFQRTLLYGDTGKNPERFLGLAPRYSTLNPKKAANAVNVIDAGGTGDDLTSIWLVGWGPDTAHCIFPEGSPCGLKQDDLGEEPAYDEKGGEYRVYKTHFSWDVGFTLRDWRYVVRIANISRSMLLAEPPLVNGGETSLKNSSGTALKGHNLYELLIKAIAQVPSLSGARFAFYCNRTVETYLRLQRTNIRNVQLTLEEVGGRTVTKFDGIPFRRVDALQFGETKVTA